MEQHPARAFAVVMRTYQWDGFIQRQMRRYQQASIGGDFFVSADETNARLGDFDGERVLATTNEQLLALGLPNRFEKGSLIWWNNDYPTYAFSQAYPHYDYYVFVEYDSVVRAPIASIVAEIAGRGLDFVAAPIEGELKDWFWWPYARQSYSATELRASLNCISIYSNRAMRLLFDRRLEMGRDPRVKSWPISEAFVATEIARAGMAFASLAEFGDVTHYDWFPPVLEGQLDEMAGRVFIHPVLDTPRYVSSVLRYGDSWLDYFNPRSTLRQRLDKCPPETYASRLRAESWRRFKALQQERWERRVLKANLILRRAK
jgi:hypothetical protein